MSEKNEWHFVRNEVARGNTGAVKCGPLLSTRMRIVTDIKIGRTVVKIDGLGWYES